EKNKVGEGFHAAVYRVSPGVVMKRILREQLDSSCRQLRYETYYATVAGMHGIGPRVYTAQNRSTAQGLMMEELMGYESVHQYLGIQYDVDTRSHHRTNTRAFPKTEILKTFAKLHALKMVHGDASLS